MPNFKDFDKVLELIHQTGDKVIVVSENHSPYVLMSIGDYQALLHASPSVKDLSEDQLLNKINRDIAVWKSSQENSDDYDLEQFKIDYLRNKEQDKHHPEQDQEKSVDNSQKEDSEEKYYIEPVD